MWFLKWLLLQNGGFVVFLLLQMWFLNGGFGNGRFFAVANGLYSVGLGSLCGLLLSVCKPHVISPSSLIYFVMVDHVTYFLQNKKFCCCAVLLDLDEWLFCVTFCNS